MEEFVEYDFYLAGPFFTYEQKMQQDFIEMMFDVNKKKCFSPRKDAGILPDNPTKTDMYDVFMADLKAIDNSNILFANISYKDTGTCVEIGYALKAGIPVVLYWDKENNDGGKLNLMLAMACDCNVIQTKQELAHFIQTEILPDASKYFEVE